MLNNVKTQSINNKTDFLDSIVSITDMTEALTSSVGINQYFYDSTTNIVHACTDGTKNFYYNLFFANVNVGDVLEASADIFVESGNPTSIKTRVVERASKFSISSVIDEFKNDKVGEWITLKYRYVISNTVHKNTCFVVGLTGGGLGTVKIKMKNIKASVISSIGVGSSKKVNDIKKGELYKNSSGWIRRTDFVGENVTLSETDANTLRVTYETPFTGLRPIVNVVNEWFSSSYKYKVTVNSKLDYFELKFYDSSNTIVPLASLTNDIFVGFQAIGEKGYFES